MILLSLLTTFVFPIAILCVRGLVKNFTYRREWTDDRGVKHFIGYNCQQKEKDSNHND